jgi:hypothetical protein
VVEARLGEEHRAKELLSTLDGMGPDAEGFDTLLIKLRKDVLAHAEHEEREEFPLLRTTHDPKRLEAMAGTVRAAEAVAPTRPHPGLEGATANVPRVRDSRNCGQGKGCPMVMVVDHAPLPDSWYRAVPASGHTKMVACCDDLLGFERQARRKTAAG